MLEFLRQLVAGTGGAWRTLSADSRIQVIVAAVIAVGLVSGVVFVGGQSQYVPLFARLDVDDTNEVSRWLSERGIDYRLDDVTQAIEIPVEDVQRARLGLAELGLPRVQGVVGGYDNFSSRELLDDQWLRDASFMGMLQRELQQQLNQFDFVRRSYVFIRDADVQLTSDSKTSTATVTLDVTRALSRREIQAILHTTGSFGGPNLDENSITLSLTDGTLLHSPVEDEYAALASDQHAAQIELENQREEKIRRAFKDIGVNAIVRVSAELDWTDQETNTREVTDGALINSHENLITEAQFPSDSAPGALANIPEDLGGSGMYGGTTETREFTESYEPSETVTKTMTRPGVVKKYRVSAFIEGAYTESVDGFGNPTGQTDYQPLTDAQIANYTQFILNAVGDGAEPTEIAVFDHPFKIDQIATAQVLPVSTPSAFTDNGWAELALQVLAMAVVFLILRGLMRQTLVAPSVQEEEVLAGNGAPELNRHEMADEIERLSEARPEVVASLLRSWMTEEDS